MVHTAGSRRRLAAIIGIKDGTIIAWEGGSMPYQRTMRQIAEKTGIPIEWLREGRGDPDEALAPLKELRNQPRSAQPVLQSSGARGRLADALQALGITAADLAKRIGYQTGVVQAVVEGGARISEQMAKKIAGELGIDAEDLLSGSDDAPIMAEDAAEGTVGATPKLRVPPGSKARYVPLLSWAQAGALNAGHLDEAYDYKGVISIDVKDTRAFAVEIRGNSMEPRIAEGDRAIVTPGREPRAGDTVIARTVTGDVMCKLFQSKDDGRVVVLSSWNPAFPPVELRREEIAWIYPVRQIVQNYGQD
jgi:phage repressor protein C with HTH and peptisase S24 domain